MVDADAKPPPGFMLGNLLWVGNFDECVNTTAVYRDPNQTEPVQPFKGQYCKVGIPLSPGQAPPTDVAVSMFCSIESRTILSCGK